LEVTTNSNLKEVDLQREKDPEGECTDYLFENARELAINWCQGVQSSTYLIS